MSEVAEIAGRPRQWPPTLDMALGEAIRMFRSQAREYRDRRNIRMDKKVRQALAASYEDWARQIEAVRAHLANDGER